MENTQSIDDYAAASVVVALATNSGKRTCNDGEDKMGFSSNGKSDRLENRLDAPVAGPPIPRTPGGSEQAKTLKPFPYFYYRDFSTFVDPDPLTPLTPPGRVPNFPAKMHSILSRKDLSDVVAWMPHGRAWRVLKPREFEVRVIPTYFEHTKFSSFIRQANGWGFRRVTQGFDRNTYYHELFLRGLPHLCKMMKRPGISEKQAADPDQEPDFYKISEEYPVPDESNDESILLQCTIKGGPKARMPIYLGGTRAANYAQQVALHQTHPRVDSLVPAASIAPSGAMNQYQLINGGNQYQPPGRSPDSQFGAATLQQNNNQVNLPHYAPNMTNTNTDLGHSVNMSPHINSYVNLDTATTVNMNSSINAMSSYAVVPVPQQVFLQRVAAQQPNSDNSMMQSSNQVSVAQNFAGAYQTSPACSTASSQFAAGFAAATALSHQQFRTILGHALSSFSSEAAAQSPQQALLPSTIQPVPTILAPPAMHQGFQPHQLQPSCEPQFQLQQQPHTVQGGHF